MRRYNYYFDYGITAVNSEPTLCSDEDSDEYIESIVERGRLEYYEAWFEYVREYD